MRHCLKHLGLICAAGSLCAAASMDASRMRTVVKVDGRSGRLVRSVVIAPLVVAPRKIDVGVAAHEDAAVSATLPLAELVEQTARRHNVDPLLVHAVIQVESSYNPNAVSPKGAQGLMQLMPATARRFGVSDSFRVAENLDGGVRYLRYLQDLFQEDLRLTIAAYNAGEAAVIKYNWNVPPFPETLNYVYQVGRRLGEARLRQKKQQVQKTVETAQLQLEKAELVKVEEVHRPVDSYVDSEGRLYLNTR
jgi:soluble lytic murein transglycosylase-like protein